jgi:hypothetical protein
MSLNIQQIIGLSTGIGSAVVLLLSDLLSSGISLPLHITAGTLAVITAVLAAVNKVDGATTITQSEVETTKVD